MRKMNGAALDERENMLDIVGENYDYNAAFKSIFESWDSCIESIEIKDFSSAIAELKALELSVSYILLGINHYTFIRHERLFDVINIAPGITSIIETNY